MDRLDLPEEFLKDMKELLGSEYNDYLSVLKDRPYSGLRVNTLKTDPDSVSRKFGGLEKIPWTENGFFISDESVFTKNPCYYAGLYYIQEPSAMPLDACFVDGNSVIAFCPSEKVPSEKVREWIRTALRKDGLTPETVVCSDRNGFIRALKQKTRMEENTVGSEKIQKTVSILKSISY